MANADKLHLAIAAYHAERYDEALRIVLDIHEEAQRDAPTLKAPEFIVQFTWDQIAEQYEPARAALAAHRDAQIACLLAGDVDTEGWAPGYRQKRFHIVAGLNETLGDPHATHALFLAMLERMPEHALECAHHALPALIAVGDFALASRYLPDPLPRLAELNRDAAVLPLFPPPGAAPRLAAEFSNYMREVWQRAAILDGLGRAQEAAALRDEAVAGLVSDEMRALARRELDAPGTITSAMTEHQMAHEMRPPGA